VLLGPDKMEGVFELDEGTHNILVSGDGDVYAGIVSTNFFLPTSLLQGTTGSQWIVPQLSIRINYNGTWSILIQ